MADRRRSPIVLPDDPSFGPEVQLDYPGYRSTRWRAPDAAARRRCPRSSTTSTGPVFGEDAIERARPRPDARSTRASRSASGSSSPAACSTRTAGRCRTRSSRSGRRTRPAATATSVDQHPAPLDPNFSGAGRCLTDAEGRYRFVTIKPGAYPWGNHENAWRPAHIHFSLFGRAFTQRLVTQMYFPGDPLFAYDPIFTLGARPEGARAAGRALRPRDDAARVGARRTDWDIVLGRGGTGTTPMENGDDAAADALADGRPVLRDRALPPAARTSSPTGRRRRGAADRAAARRRGRADQRRADRDLGRRRRALGPERHRRRRALLVRRRRSPSALPGQAPRLDVFVFARGLLRHQLTRIYFPDEAEANAADPVLSALDEDDRATLVAEQEDGALRFDIRMQGDRADRLLRALTTFAAIFVPDELRDGASRTRPGSRRCSTPSARSRRPRPRRA